MYVGRRCQPKLEVEGAVAVVGSEATVVSKSRPHQHEPVDHNVKNTSHTSPSVSSSNYNPSTRTKLSRVL